MIRKFASLIIEFYRSIKDLDDLDQVKKYLVDIDVFKVRKASHKKLLQNVKNEVMKASTAFNLVLILKSYWSFCNHFLLGRMIRKFVSEAAKEKLTQYVISLEALPIAELPSLIQPIANTDSYHSQLLILKMKKNILNISGESLGEIHESVATLLDIVSYALLLKRISKGSNGLEYLIPNCVTFTIDTLDLTTLQDAQVHSISFGGTSRNCCKGKSKLLLV